MVMRRRRCARTTRWAATGLLLAAAIMRAAAQSPDSLIAAAREHMRADRHEDAVRAFSAVMRIAPGEVEAPLGIGWIEMKRGNFARAVDWFQRARQVQDTNAWVHVSLGRAYTNLALRSGFRRVVHGHRARRAFERALEIEPQNVSALEPLIAWHLVVPRGLGGDPARAERYARRLQEIAPLRGLLALGRIAESRKDPAAARARFGEATVAFPDSADAWLALAGALNRAGDSREGIAALERCLASQPAQPDCTYELGKTLAEEGRDPARARAVLAALIDALPADARARRSAALYYLAVAHEAAGDRDAARDAKQRARELDPGGVRERDRLRRSRGIQTFGDRSPSKSSTV